jgi:hypothetical protein
VTTTWRNPELAVDEACANVIEHAHHGDATKDDDPRGADDATADRGVDTGPASIRHLPAADLDTLCATESGGLGT